MTLRDKISNKVYNALLEVAGKTSDEVTMDTPMAVLGLTSLNFVTLMGTLEEAIDVTVPYAEMKNATTVGEFVQIATDIRMGQAFVPQRSPMKKIIVINFGSTSTKIAYFEDKDCKIRESLSHDVEEIKACKSVVDQYDFRKAAILRFMDDHDIDIDSLDAIASRGGQTEPIPGGTYEINDAMVEQVRSMEYGHHVCGVGVLVAYDLCKEANGPVPYTTDTPTTDEMDPLAYYSGLREIKRASCVQALNVKAMSRYYAEQQGKPFKDIRLITVMLGGGIGVVGIQDGRMVDAPDGLEGEGPFSNNRCGTMPVGKIVKMCYSGQYNRESMLRHINGEAGLMSYLGTTDIRGIMKRIADGDEEAREVMEAMCYQTSKEIGAMATVLKGKVDAILLIGGMANVEFICKEIENSCSFIAPVVVMPGEREMEALAEGAYEALTGLRETKHFVPKEEA